MFDKWFVKIFFVDDAFPPTFYQYSDEEDAKEAARIFSIADTVDYAQLFEGDDHCDTYTDGESEIDDD